MQLKYRLPLAILATAALTVCLHAQADDEDEEEFGSFGFYASSPQGIKVSLNMTQAPQVSFGNLGNIPVTFDHTSAGVTTRNYMDGAVGKDGFRYDAANSAFSEVDSEGDRLHPTGGRYRTYVTPGDASSAVVTDLLAFNPNYTRNWSYQNSSQALSKPGYIAFNIYSATTKGASAAMTGSRGYTGGIELAVSRNITDVKKRVSLSVTAGVTLTGINSSKRGQVTSTLNTYTDYYLYQPYSGIDAPVLPNNTDGTAPSPIYTGPSYVTAGGLTTETTTTVSSRPDLHEDDPNGDEDVEVDGVWKVKGAYFTFKVGPEITARLTRSIGVRASVGVAGSYVGTTYSATESFTMDGIDEPIGTGGTGEQSSTTKKLLPGYYANLDATWALNDRTGFFAGVSYDNLGDYSQSVAGRTAKIDLSSTAGVRGGLTIKF